MTNAWKFSLLMLIFGVFFGCSINDEIEKNPDYDNAWNLVNISGGLAGVDENYSTNQIQWYFGNTNGILKVLFNSDESIIYNGLEAGTYTYIIQEINDKEYLFINDSEFGRYTLSENKLVINQNEISSGNGADGFILKFQR